jgi:hypothetical protein
MNSPSLALLAALLALPACARSQPPEGQGSLPLKHEPRPTEAAITVADLKTRLYIFADDSMMGREAGTDGNRKATDYLAAELRRIGLAPAGEKGSYFQSLPFVNRGVDESASRLSAGGTSLALWQDYAPLVRRRGVPRSPDGAPAVYGGTLGAAGGLSAEQARGKVVVLAVPRSGHPYELANAGARVPRALGTAAARAVPPETAAVPSYFLVTRRAAAALLGRPLDEATLGASGATVRGTPAFVVQPASARNVIAVLPGSDPALRGQYVALGAHSDHVGPTRPMDHDSLRAFLTAQRSAARSAMPALPPGRTVRLDSIHNGADDDASGSMALLEVAEALAAAPTKPRRSILFVWHTAEEMGMVGARWFTDRPTVPRDSIVAQLNLDMVGRGTAEDVPNGGPRHLQVIGARRLSTALGEVLEAVNAARAEPFALDYSWDANGHPEQIYCRSDHYMYARHGIPIAFFMTGLHRDYHQVTDEPQYIDYPHLAAITGFVRDLAVRLADLDHRPRVDRRRPDPNSACSQ